ncbi:hypothetical protein BAMA_18290 [Bacillus manliponensis]|uniref:DUF3841 domain-containing protein n=1 Tax=Bacillus manliponensis TaxID=574376 RepID=A0A073JPZ9_9BACI|nr:DUF3841 domain-containing protein [Bacillus manliponensis]KEK17159.1 hypothetical protein BAMA_18290 [Bacillus manliponensis]
MGTFWTIQSIEKWQEVKDIGYLTGAYDYVWPEFIEPYQWMVQQMKSRIKDCNQEDAPIWLWTERPDLRRSGHLGKGERGVLLKVDIDDKRVLLSDFQAWHFVLDGTYCNVEAKEDSELNLSSESIQRSWEKIFDLNYLYNHPEWGDCVIQGVTCNVFLHEITLEKEFISR